MNFFPELKPFVDERGRLTVKILKALYGLIQSAALWFALIYGFLKAMGFESNIVNKCVLNMSKDGRKLTIILYVDNILLFWFRIEDSKWFVKKLEKKFGKLSVETSNAFTYLGMYL